MKTELETDFPSSVFSSFAKATHEQLFWKCK